jgi:hypothetical protein
MHLELCFYESVRTQRQPWPSGLYMFFPFIIQLPALDLFLVFCLSILAQRIPADCPWVSVQLSVGEGISLPPSNRHFPSEWPDTV